MVQVSGEFPASRLLPAGHMGPSSVVFLFGFLICILSSEVLAAVDFVRFSFMERSKRGSVAYPVAKVTNAF
jgi:hypothetical protein